MFDLLKMKEDGLLTVSRIHGVHQWNNEKELVGKQEALILNNTFDGFWFYSASSLNIHTTAFS